MMIENLAEMLGTIVVAIIGSFLFAIFWSFICIFRALVGVLYPTPSRTVRMWQLITLALLILGLAAEVGGFAAFFVFQFSWMVALPVFALGLLLLTVARMLASFIERVCLVDNNAAPADSSPAHDVQPLPWKGPT